MRLIVPNYQEVEPRASSLATVRTARTRGVGQHCIGVGVVYPGWYRVHIYRVVYTHHATREAY